MSGDYSRFGFDPRSDYKHVLLQQGRPLTDRDWNDQSIMAGRRIQAGSYDTFIQAVVPATTPDGFKLSFDGSGALQIGRGRMYVDGLLAENHGTGAAVWDTALAETYGTDPTAYLAVAPATNGQPYLPNPPALPGSGGLAVAYLDVWQREVTQFEDAALVESALGVDTTTRLQTVWQVKLLANVGAGTTCATPPDQIAGWDALVAPSAGRLTTATGVVPGPVNPCIIPPAAGYTGLENQLYRVEIHDGGAPGTATFKWSRDDASVMARVQVFVDPSHIVVDSVGKDDVLRFSDGDWIEITDDWLELNGLPGEMHRIAIGDGVDDATRTITLQAPVTAGLFPVDADGKPDASRHTRIRRWDQQGKVLDSTGALYGDLDSAITGTIATPAGATQILLENGILVGFSLDPAGGTFHSGDFWVFAARANDGTLELLDAAPPRGIHHHYTKLAVITFPGTITDCRTIWPPVDQGGDCTCTRCVTPQSHADGSLTLQKAIDDVIATGGTVCLHEGTYDVEAPLKIANAKSLHFKGQGAATILAAGEGAFEISGSGDVLLADFAIARFSKAEKGGAIAVAATSALAVTRVGVTGTGKGLQGAALAVGVLPVTATVRDCSFTTAIGIGRNLTDVIISGPGGTDTDDKGADALNLVVENTAFHTSLGGVQLNATGASGSTLRIRGNSFVGCSDQGILVTANATPGLTAEIASNRLDVTGIGIVAGTAGLHITGNDIAFAGAAADDSQGILLASPLLHGTDQKPDTIQCQIIGNRITGFGGGGVMARIAIREGMVKQNQIVDCGAGIVLTSQAAQTSGLLDHAAAQDAVPLHNGAISIENNQIESIEPPTPVDAAGRTDAATGVWLANPEATTTAAGIWVEAADSVHIAGNFLRSIGTHLRESVSRFGIMVMAGDRACITANEVSDLGPRGEFSGRAVGIMVRGLTGGLTVGDNLVRRSTPSVASQDAEAEWLALWVIAGDAAADKQSSDAAETKSATSTANFANFQAANFDNSLVRVADTNLARIAPRILPKMAAPKPQAENPSANQAPAAVNPGQLVVVVGTGQGATGTASVAIRGNRLDAQGRAPVAVVTGLADCVFTDNHCLQLAPGKQPEGEADVMIAGQTIAAANNRIEGGRFALVLKAGTGQEKEKACTVLGNITRGAITVNGDALAAPWKPLNLTGV